MRSSGQYCALAKALDVVGDRWSLLIVRELMLRDACRYTDLRQGLPGIATNLLAHRLRELESAGIVSREQAPPPIATTLFRLTERGCALRSAVHALGRWGAPLLTDDFGDDTFRTHWLALPIEWSLGERILASPPLAVGILVEGQALVVEFGAGRVKSRPRSIGEAVDVTLAGPPLLVFQILTGMVELDDACARGAEVEGDVVTLRRLLESAVDRAHSASSTTASR
jgi:DNA-binding HxlR family transcriptional regulator